MHLVHISVSLLLLLDICAAESNTCGDPPSIDNADVADVTNNPDPDVYSVGARANYVCQFGYVANGRGRSIKCEENGGIAQWTKPQFTCTPQSCGDPGHIDNGHRVGSLFTFPNAVRYECDPGYILEGTRARYCQTSGVWSGRLPKCQIISCDPPNSLENGQVFASSYEYESELRYKCDPGFTLNTNEKVYCTEDRTWSHKDVACIENLCEEPIQPAYGNVVISGADNRPRAGSIAFFSCDEGRILSGSTSSKCMENGHWVFPPPECLEPCNVPVISNGVIMRKETRYYRDSFQVLKVGTHVNEDDELLYLKCSDGYEAAGSKEQETRITCKDGKWSENLCQPASCKSRPPPVKNAYANIINKEHNGTVSYRCERDFRKAREGVVWCDHGKWIGLVPECISTSCAAKSLSFNGFVVKGKPIYKNEEVYPTICDTGYEITEGHTGFTCMNGIWAGNMPPCVARGCDVPPPEIENGKASYYSTSHSATATYECEDPFILVGYQSIKCHLGEWKGQLPYCKDRRCYLNNLNNRQHVSSETQAVIFSGDRLNVSCEAGYSATAAPFCNNGDWSLQLQPLCLESDCVIPSVYHGSIGYIKMSDYYFNWKKFRYEQSRQFITIPQGTTITRGSSLILTCYGQYLVHGIGGNEATIICREGKWSPDPVCLSYGQKYFPTTTKPRMKLPTTVGYFPRSSPIPINSFTPVTTTSHKLTTEVNEDKDDHTGVNIMLITSSTEPPEEECFCEYPLSDSKVVAHADGMRLIQGDKVKNGSTVVFRCLHVGFHLFRGLREINCSDCQPWHSSDFPSCSDPTKGNTVIISEQLQEVLPDGTVQLLKGWSANFTCIAVESGVYPKWNVPDESNLSYNEERREREKQGDVLYVTHLYINDAAYVNEGTYDCSIEGFPETAINVIVTDPDLRCPEFEEDGEIIIKYDLERRERSKVHFSCPPKRELVGKSELTCLNTGDWSDSPPSCSGIRCQTFEETELLKIKYHGDRDVDTIASFHCFSPGKRSGVSYTKCLANGSWEHPAPTCMIPPCSSNDLLSSVPPNTEPLIDKGNNDTFPYKTTVKLICKKDLISVGNPVATCDKDGKWNISDIQCESGCKRPTEYLDVNIRLNPDKNIYKFLEKITLSCPYGMNLSKGAQLIMCLLNGWSPNDFPHCIENKREDTKTSANKDDIDY